PFADAHDAAYDVDATARCFFGLITQRVLVVNEVKDPANLKYEAPKLDDANFAKADTIAPETATDLKKAASKNIGDLKDLPFAHLHNHTQYSILQSASSISGLVDKAKELGMPAVAMSDHGNMMGAYHFVRDALKADITPIVGCEFNVCENHIDKSRQDNGFQTVLLAKNKNGYHNIAKLSSTAFTDGFYYVPRIDKALLSQYKDDVI